MASLVNLLADVFEGEDALHELDLLEIAEQRASSRGWDEGGQGEGPQPSQGCRAQEGGADASACLNTVPF